MRRPTPSDRTSGVLLHPTSLPGPHGSGDVGPAAFAFLGFLERAAQSFWQMLPVGPVGFGNSPYSGTSAFAGNPMLVSLDVLAEEGLIDADRLASERLPSGGRVDYPRAERQRRKYLHLAHDAFVRSGKGAREALEAFRHRERAWLDDFALFSALKHANGGTAWTTWDEPYKSRRRFALERARRELSLDVDRVVFEQYEFALQWDGLRRRAAEKGIGLVGDIPLFVAHDSADVWQHREYFELDAQGEPTSVAGVPPDYFSKTGQRWGNPLYRWKKLERDGFSFWVERLRKAMSRFDVLRLDHFIGFYRNWKIPASCNTAEIGSWVKGPRDALFRIIERELGDVPFIAEDLGVVTPGVVRLRKRFGFPGIKVLQFAFGSDPQAPAFLPHAHTRSALVTTGSHDNDTTVGWFRDPAEESAHAHALRYLATDGREIHWDMIRAAMMSVARTAILPAQDLLGLDSRSRMNTPGTSEGNWEFRLQEGALDEKLAARLGAMTRLYGRGPHA